MQIVPPHDAGIAESIERNLNVSDEAWTPDQSLQTSSLCVDNTEALKEEYIGTLAKLNQVSRCASPMFHSQIADELRTEVLAQQHRESSFQICLHAHTWGRLPFRPVRDVCIRLSAILPAGGAVATAPRPRFSHCQVPKS